MLKKARVLVVEDESILRERLKLLLSECSFIESVELAQNGIEALEKILVFTPQIIISDIVMPGMNGIELLGHCRQQGLVVEFILLSGHKDFQYAQQAVKYRATNYILKPLVATELFDAIEQAIDRINNTSTSQMSKPPVAHSATVQQLLETIEKNLADSELSLKQICQTTLFVNETHAGRIFLNETGVKFSDYVNERRIRFAKATIVNQPSLSVVQLAEASGFGNNYRYFIEVFKKICNTTPKQYQLSLRQRSSQCDCASSDSHDHTNKD